MNSISTTKTALIKIAGYDIETAKSCTTSEVTKMAKHGGLVLIPAIIGLFSMSYAIYLITQNQSLSLLGGIVWGIVILIIDRSIVSMHQPGFNFGLLTRFFFAIVIGFVVAEPVVLLAFKDSIKESLNEAYLKQKEIVNDKFAPRVTRLDNQLTLAEEKLERKQQAYTKEMDGTGGSGKANKGPIYKQKYADYQAELIKYNQLRQEVEEDKTQIISEFNQELRSIKANQAHGLLGQFRALHAIEDKEVTYATWALRLFFFFIELIPFMIKLSPGKKTDLYWNLVDNNNMVQLEIVTSNNTLRKELMESEEKSLNKERILKLNEADTQKIALSNEKNTFYLMKELANATDKKLKQDLRIIKSIKDDVLREKLLEEINIAFGNYYTNMEALIAKSNSFYSTNL